MITIGIDIGTSYSSVCILDKNNQPERVKIATGTGMFGDAHSLPSAVFVESDGRVLLGQSAIANRMRIPENFKSEFKRDLGQPAPYLLGDRQFLPEDLYKEFFIYLKKCVEDYTHESVTEATITCTAVFNRSKKELIQSAAKKAGLLSITMLDEPSAAAYCYLNAGKLREDDTLLVYDLGGGTFDVALLRYTNGAFVQLTQPLGIACCGGADFDKLIYDHIMDQIGEERLSPVRANPAFFRKFATQIMETSIKAKHHLSSADVFSDVIPVGYDAVDYTLTQNAYNAMIAPIVDETVHQVRAILKNAGLQAKDVSTVLLVGGASRTPLVRERLSREMGKEPLKDIDPELAVCAGAAVRHVASNTDVGTGYEEAAMRGVENAQYTLGLCYNHGLGVKKDFTKAVEWFEKAAKAGHAQAQFELGAFYFYGDKVPEDKVKAAEWFTKAAEQGFAQAQYKLGICYRYGWGVKEDIKKSVELILKAAEQGNVEAQSDIGNAYRDGSDVMTKDEKKAFYWSMKAAQQGDNHRMDTVGDCYYEGKGVQQDYVAAVECYTKAAEQRNQFAQCRLGRCYSEGRGVAKNLKKAAEWYAKAAQQGNGEAQLCLDLIEKAGLILHEDKEKAINRYKNAAKLGDAHAQYMLGLCYRYYLYPLYSEEYIQWCTKAAEQGYPQAQYHLAEAYLYEDDYTILWRTKAAEQGYVPAQSYLGTSYMSGLNGQEKNSEMAFKWYEKAAAQGDGDSMYSIGHCYFDGDGVAQNYTKSVEWYAKACQTNEPDGYTLFRLGVCYFSGFGVKQDLQQAGELWAKAAERGENDAVECLKLLKREPNGKYVKNS